MKLVLRTHRVFGTFTTLLVAAGFVFCGGFEVAGAGVYLPASEIAFEGAVWGVAGEHGDARLERCRAFMSVPGPIQTVQRAEFWGAIIALQSYWPCRLGVFCFFFVLETIRTGAMRVIHIPVKTEETQRLRFCRIQNCHMFNAHSQGLAFSYHC